MINITHDPGDPEVSRESKKWSFHVHLRTTFHSYTQYFMFSFFERWRI